MHKGKVLLKKYNIPVQGVLNLDSFVAGVRVYTKLPRVPSYLSSQFFTLRCQCVGMA